MATRTQVLSLFGATPAQIRQQQALAEAKRVQAIRDPYQQTGAVLGAGLARLFAGPSPEETQAMQMQKALQGVDVSDPIQLRELASTIKDFAPNRALQILDRASQLEGEARDIAMAKERLNLERRRVVTGERAQQASETYQESQLQMRQAGLDLDTARFEFQRDQAGQLTPYQQTQVELAKQRLQLQREQFENLTPYQQRQLEFQEKQLDLSEKKYENLSQKQQQELAMAEKRLRLSEAELYAKYTPESVTAHLSSGGNAPLEPRPKVTELPVPKAFSEALYNDFDAAVEQAGLDIKDKSLFGDKDYRRAIYKRAFELKSIPKFRNLSDAEAVKIIIEAEEPTQQQETSTGNEKKTSEIEAFKQKQAGRVIDETS